MSKDSFEAIYEELFPIIYRFVRIRVPQCDVEDVTAEIITKIWRALPKFRGESSLKSWSLRIAYNYVADYYRQNKGKKVSILPLNEEVKTGEIIDDHSDQISDLLLINKILTKLSESQIAVIQLRLIEGFSATEVANILGTTQQAVDSLLYRAKKSFRKHYEKEITGGEPR